jgi:REP-associated tyrosine transposase
VPRKPRIDLADSLHHVTALANGGHALFRESADRGRFMDQLRKVIDKHEWHCQAYCLMSTHFHLLVYTVEPTLSSGMRQLCSGYAQWFNWKYDRKGHVFVGRFGSQHIVEEPHLMEVHRYVALNPVRAEQCADPGQWPWGSYRALAGLERAPDFLDVRAVHELFSLQPGAAVRAYRAFVLSGMQEGRGQTPPGSDPLGSDPSRSALRPVASTQR